MIEIQNANTKNANMIKIHNANTKNVNMIEIQNANTKNVNMIEIQNANTTKVNTVFILYYFCLFSWIAFFPRVHENSILVLCKWEEKEIKVFEIIKEEKWVWG